MSGKNKKNTAFLCPTNSVWRDWWEYKPQKIYLTLLFGTLAEQFNTLNHTDLSWVAYVDTCGDSDPLLVGPSLQCHFLGTGL